MGANGAALAAAVIACASSCLRAAATAPWSGEYAFEAHAGPVCKAIGGTGVDYADQNLTVTPTSRNGGAGDHGCCAACAAYNEKPDRAGNCSFVVWHRDSAVCALKATANKPKRGLHLLAFQAGAAPPEPSSMDLIILPNASSVDKGAVCLDGSAPAIYYRKANTSADPAADNKWVLYFKGGGWCTSSAGCAARAGGIIGSSNKLLKSQPTFAFGGPLDADPVMNPAFAHFHHVVLWYCDGGSFSGDRADPDVVDGSNIWYRGKRNLDAMLAFLKQGYGLDDAQEVLLSGGSAGGLSTYLHADYVRSQFADTVKFKAAPISGFFLNHATVAGVPAYIDEMQWVYTAMNSSGGVNAACVANTPVDLQWQCIFANASYAHTTTPIFPLNSALDAWQMANVYQLDEDLDTSCGVNEFDNCTAAEVDALNRWEKDFLHDMLSTPTFQKAGNGGFIESCLEHCAAQTSRTANSYAIDGVTMMQGLTAWWEASGTEPAKSHWHLPCSLSEAAPHQCNPTCMPTA